MDTVSIKTTLLNKLLEINKLIRILEDNAKQNSFNIENDKVYIIAQSQRSLIKEILDIKE